MNSSLHPLGHARVFRHPNGELVVDTESLRRTHFAGNPSVSGWDPDDFDDDDELDDDFDDFGAWGDPERRRERRRARLARKRDRSDRRHTRRSNRLSRKARRWGIDDEPPSRKPSNDTDGWGMTAVGGTDSLAEAGSASIRIRLQHDFRANDITFTGSVPGAKVHSIFFGDSVVWSTPDGIDVSVFAANGFLRGLLKGQTIGAGLDVTINGSLPEKGVFTATLTGSKPVGRSC